MTLQEKIFYCRKKEGLSQEGLAEKIGVSRQAISKWETGEATPEVGKLLLLAKAFNVTTDWLLSEEEPEEKVSNACDWEKGCNIEENFARGGKRRKRSLLSVIMKLIAKYSWIAGIYIAVVGLIIVGVGSGFRYLANSMINSFGEVSSQMVRDVDGFYGDDYSVEGNREYIENVEEWEDVFGDVEGSIHQEGVNNTETKTYISPMVSTITTIENVFSGIIIFIGTVILIGGIVLAVYLKKNGDKMQDKLKEYM